MERPPFLMPGRRRSWPARHPVLATLGALLLAGLAGLLLLFLTLPNLESLETEWPERTAYMELREREARARGEELRIAYRPVPLSRIPATVQRAVLVAEDAGFYGHSGFDWHEVRAAVEKAWEEKTLPRGASTISQQLARNLYLSPRRNPLRKVREALLTWHLERKLGKGRMLELYLNVIEFGPGTFGVEAAARRYFGTGVSSLGPERAAQLAATIPGPLRHNPATATGQFRWRTALIQRRAFGAAEERIEVTPPPEVEVEVADPFAEPEEPFAEPEEPTTEDSTEDPPRDRS